jgi:hypothetical protein
MDNIIDEHTDSTLRAAYVRFSEAALELRQEINACADDGRDDHSQESDLWPSADELLEAVEVWADDSVVSMLFDKTGAPILEAFIDRAKAEVMHDIDNGIVPKTVRSFSALHDHVDANEYGGFCEADMAARLDKHFRIPSEGDSEQTVVTEGLTRFMNAVQNAVGMWLASGRA